ncbi:alpha/beta hydrolase [Snuella sedimenti]|uniref:Alpha/beta fold hydrolase n=1 Tax=Snuella sedimenti TaxID=2798802 RepID=A0A8J7IS69_9FLAO|nr:alpha/beta hydrolase [Snuella sedimenti]MBJ6366920.1 alpha/beta fold hydrolase [Snuella sedimenti]
MKKHLAKLIGIFINLIGIFSSEQAAKLAIKLFSTPKKGKKLSTEAHDFLDTALKEEINCNGTSIMSYRWIGKKETVLLVHGWESNAFRWKDLIENLKKLNYNIIALDAPAHGNSEGHIFNSLAYSECIYKVAKKFNTTIIIGHSVGGMATVFAQYKHQLTFIDKLVLLGAPSNFTGMFNRYKCMMGYSKKVSNAMDLFVLKHYDHHPNYFSAANFSKDIKAKGLIIHDKNDDIIPFSDTIDFKNSYKNAELIATTGYGHGLKFDTVNNHIIDFISS